MILTGSLGTVEKSLFLMLHGRCRIQFQFSLHDRHYFIITWHRIGLCVYDISTFNEANMITLIASPKYLNLADKIGFSECVNKMFYDIHVIIYLYYNSISFKLFFPEAQ